MVFFDPQWRLREGAEHDIRLNTEAEVPSVPANVYDHIISDYELLHELRGQAKESQSFPICHLGCSLVPMTINGSDTATREMLRWYLLIQDATEGYNPFAPR